MLGIVIAALAVCLMVWFFSRRARFEMEFRDGELVAQRGKASRALTADFADVAQRAKLTGKLSLHRDDKLSFSGEISELDQQRFRNVLAARH